MKVLDGGKDNPNFNGQRMCRDLKGNLIPEMEPDFSELPAQFSPEMREAVEKIQELVKDLIKNSEIKFLMAFAMPPKEPGDKEGVQTGTQMRGSPNDQKFLLHILMEYLVESGVLAMTRQ